MHMIPRQQKTHQNLRRIIMSSYYNRNKSSVYVWRLTWFNGNTCRDCERTFRNKQQALMFMSKIKANYYNTSIYLERWYGD